MRQSKMAGNVFSTACKGAGQGVRAMIIGLVLLFDSRGEILGDIALADLFP